MSEEHFMGLFRLLCSDEKLTKEKFVQLVQQKYQRSLAEPGEAVGLLAAQVRISSDHALHMYDLLL